MIPAKEYFSHLYSDPEGDCSNKVHMAEAAELFSSVMLSDISATEIVTSCTIWQKNSFTSNMMDISQKDLSNV